MEEFNFNCVLLIDADGIVNFTNYRLIKKMNISRSIQTATNKNEALTFLEDFSLKNKNYGPELILLGNNISFLNELEFLNNFEKMNFRNKEKIKIIVLTTSDSDQKDITKSSNTVNKFIMKPLTRENLIKALNSHTAGMHGL